MFEKFLSANIGDFRQRYEGCWGWYINHETGQRMLANISGIRGHEGERGMVEFTDKNGISFSLYSDSEKNVGFEFLPTNARCYNTDIGTYVVARHPARQWKRGIHSGNTRIWCCPHKEGTLRRVEINSESIANIFESTVTASAATAQWLAGKIPSVALNEHFWLMSSTQEILLYQTRVGTFKNSKEGLNFFLSEDLWVAELKDALRNAALSYNSIKDSSK